MEGDVNSVETYLQVDVPDLPGAAINFATFQVFFFLLIQFKTLIFIFQERHPWFCPR